MTTAKSEEIQYAQYLSVAGQELLLFVESPPLFEAMLVDMRRAKKRIWLETYIFAQDAVGKEVASVLKAQARAGLDVRLIYDAVGCFGASPGFFADLERAGVHVHAFHALGEALYRFSLLRILNRRNHRKLLVIDEHVAYFGGMNIVDQSGERSDLPRRKLPVSGGWRDVHLRLCGPQQAELAESFLRSWLQAKGQRVPEKALSYRLGHLAQGAESIQFFDSGPGRKHTRAARVFLQLFQQARERILLSMAYFLPIGRVLGHLLKARKRGVRVRVVVPASSDVPLVQRATRYLNHLLIKRRVQIYERQRQMLHSKAMVVDDEWSVVGSCNLDPRSLWINYEFLAVIHSRRFARALKEIIRFEMAHSVRFTHRTVRALPWWQRLLDRLAWSLRWWL